MNTNKHELEEAAKRPGHFLPLVKQMLGLYRCGPVPLCLWYLSCGIVLFFSANFTPLEWMRGHEGSHFGEGIFLSVVLSWVFLMMAATALPFQLLGGPTSMEFIFTRALDRTVWLRAERVAVILVCLGPLLLNLVFSPLGPELTVDPGAAGSPTAKIQERYARIFSGSHLAVMDGAAKQEQLVIPHGNEMFAAWLVWAGLAGIFCVAAGGMASFQIEASGMAGGGHGVCAGFRPSGFVYRLRVSAV